MMLTCDDTNELVPEFVLGILSGLERDNVLDHLNMCSRCTTATREMVTVADQLLEFAPAAEPPVGFESKVLQRTTGTQQSKHGPKAKWYLPWAWAAVFFFIISGAFGLLTVRHMENNQVALPIRSALVTANSGKSICLTLLKPGNPANINVQVEEAEHVNETYLVRVRMNDGSQIPVGSVVLRNGHGTLKSPISFKTTSANSIEVLDATGHLRYDAKFINA